MDDREVDEYHKDDGQLCIDGLERRVGRRLDLSDFIDRPLNWDTDGTSRPYVRSQRVQARLLDQGCLM